VIVLLDFLGTVDEEDAFALAGGFWLDDIDWSHVSLLIGKAILELAPLSRQQISPGKEFVFLRELLRHLDQISRQMILPAQLKHAWKMVGLLVRLHLGDALWLHAVVGPKNIPVLVMPRLARSQ
jgi:hypothetical protein